MGKILKIGKTPRPSRDRVDHCTLLGRRVRERAELFYAHDEDIAAPVSNSATSIQPTQTKSLLAI